MGTSKRGDLRWAEENGASVLIWREDAARERDRPERTAREKRPKDAVKGAVKRSLERTDQGAFKRAVKRAPSESYLTDEYGATDRHLWKACLDVASGERRDFTESGRTIHAPNDGRGFRNMPANPNGIAWAVKQYNGFGGAWKPDRKAIDHLGQLQVMANGGVVQTPKGGLAALARRGLVKLAGRGVSGDYWDITEAGHRVVREILAARGKGRR